MLLRRTRRCGGGGGLLVPSILCRNGNRVSSLLLMKEKYIEKDKFLFITK